MRSVYTIINGEERLINNIRLDEKVKERVYSLFERNTFVFLDTALYSQVDEEVRDTLDVMGSGGDKTPEELLEKDVLFVLSETTILAAVLEIVQLVEQYTKQKLCYVIIR